MENKVEWIATVKLMLDIDFSLELIVIVFVSSIRRSIIFFCRRDKLGYTCSSGSCLFH